MVESNATLALLVNRLLNRFYYCLLLQTSWLVRWTDEWSYAGGARWHREAQLEIDHEQLQGIYQDCVETTLDCLKSEFASSHGESMSGLVEAESYFNDLKEFCLGQFENTFSQVIIPTTEISKTLGISNMSAMDRKGHRLNLF